MVKLHPAAAICALSVPLLGVLPACSTAPSAVPENLRTTLLPSPEVQAIEMFLGNALNSTPFEVRDNHICLPPLSRHQVPSTDISPSKLLEVAETTLKIPLLPGSPPQTVPEALERIDASLNLVLAHAIGPLPQIQRYAELNSIGCSPRERRLLMSPPDFATSTHDRATPSPDAALANLTVRAQLRHQWETLLRTFQGLGAEVEVLERDLSEATTRSVFTRDPVFIVPDKRLALFGRQDDLRLQRESPLIKTWCAQRGFQCELTDAAFEGGNLVYQAGQNKVLTGLTMFSDRVLETSRLETEVLRSDLARLAPDLTLVAIPCRTLHLDWKVSISPSGHVFFLTNSLGNDAADTLEKHFPGKSVPISDAPSTSMSLNGVYIGRAFVTTETTPQLTRAMAQVGYEVICPATLGLPPGSFDFLGGGPHCQTNDLK